MLSKLCVRELCVRELCVRELCAREGRRRTDGTRTGVHNQKQEPHTKIWGKIGDNGISLRWYICRFRCNMPTNAINHIAGRVCQADFQKISGLKKGDAMYQADTSRCSKSPLVD